MTGADRLLDLIEYEFESGDHDDTEFGCCFPKECCMPGPHMRCECHTAEMVDAYHDEAESEVTP